MRLDPAAILLDLAHPQGGLKMGQEGVSTGDVQGDESLLHDITAFFLELKMSILRQWKTHCSEVRKSKVNKLFIYLFIAKS